MTKTIKGIIFDLDGTLYDPFWPGLVSLKACFELAEKKGFVCDGRRQRLKRKINGEELYSYKFWKTIFEEDSKNSGSNEFPLSLIFKKAWFDYDEKKDECCDYLERLWYKVFYEKIKPFSWVHKTMKELEENGFRIGMISDSPVTFGKKKIKALRLDNYFDLNNTIWTKEIGYKKPSKHSFIKMCEMMDSSPHELLVIGDVYHKDGSGARNAKMSFLPVSSNCDFNYFLKRLWDLLSLPFE